MNEMTTTLTANLTHDPELRFTGSGKAVANLRLAHTPRTLNRETNVWEDAETTFLSGAVWGQYAENVAETLTRGTQVIVTGTLRTRYYTTNEGEARSALEIRIDEIGPALRFATAKVTRAATRTTRESGELTEDEYHQAVQNLRAVGAQPVGAGDSPF